jgi:hypothetical protein
MSRTAWLLAAAVLFGIQLLAFSAGLDSLDKGLTFSGVGLICWAAFVAMVRVDR